MKRILALLLAALLCCALFGCGGSDTARTNTDELDAALVPAATRAYTLTLSQEREFTPILGGEAAYAAEYLYSDSASLSLHLLLLRFDVSNNILVDGNTYTPSSYYIMYDLDADKIYDTEIMYAEIQGLLPNLTERDRIVLQILNCVDQEGFDFLYSPEESLRSLGEAGLAAINAELGALNAEATELTQQEIYDAAARFLENPPKGYTATGTLVHAVEYINPSVRGTPIHCYLMDIRGEFSSKSVTTNRAVVAMDIDTGEFFSNLQPEYKNFNIDNPPHDIYLVLKSYDYENLNPAALYFSSGETIIPLFADSGIAQPLGPIMTQEELAAKVFEMMESWLTNQDEFITHEVRIKRAVQVRCEGYSGYNIDCVLIGLTGSFQEAQYPNAPPREVYTIGCDLITGELYTETEANQFVNKNAGNYNSTRDFTLSAVSVYRHLPKQSGIFTSDSEEQVNLEMKNIAGLNLRLQEQNLTD